MSRKVSMCNNCNIWAAVGCYGGDCLLLYQYDCCYTTVSDVCDYNVLMYEGAFCNFKLEGGITENCKCISNVNVCVACFRCGMKGRRSYRLTRPIQKRDAAFSSPPYNSPPKSVKETHNNRRMRTQSEK